MNYFLPEFSRVIWSNKAELWRKRIEQCSNDWREFELKSIGISNRHGAIITVNPKDLAEIQRNWFVRGRDCLVLGNTGEIDGYSSASTQGNLLKVLIYNSKMFPFFDYSDKVIGKILGYPECCIQAFDKYWNQDKYIDTVWPAFQNSESIKQKCNIFLRYLGIRPIFHLPCRFDCPATIFTATYLTDEFRKLYPESYNIMRDVLRWPLEWSNVNGIAEIKFPLGKIMAKSDYFGDAEKRVIKVDGTLYPDEGEDGLVFPYSEKKRLSLAYLASTKTLKLEESAKVNGFQNEQDMEDAHYWLSNCLSRHFMVGSFIDLGAGNGALIKRIEKIYPQTIGYGVDFNNGNGKVFPANIKNFKSDRTYDIALIAEQRFTDTYNNRGEALNHIKTFANSIFIYNYSTRETEWLSFNVKKELELTESKQD